MPARVLITETLSEAAAQWLGERADVVWCAYDAPPPELNAQLAETEGLIVRTYTIVDGAFLDKAPKLKVVGRAGVGLDNIDLQACKQRGVRVVSTPDANTQAVVEYVIALMLDYYRPRTDLPASASADTFHQLRKTEVGTQLDQLTLGIVGFGRIGKRLGKAAHAIGMNLKVCDILPEEELRKAVDYPFEFVDHATLYAGSDIVTIHVDGRSENRRMLNAAAFKHLRDDCVFINAARGMLIDADDLADWAKAHPGAHAILDVHDPEPPTPDYPLHGLPNVRLLPHIASRTHQALDNMSWVVRDVLAVLEGQEPKYPA
ncbi:MAG: NAD(P)-dependent oxidoreductase [Phycisphaerales bacterium]